MIEWNRIVLLGREAGRAGVGALTAGQRFLELGIGDLDRIVQADRDCGRNMDPQRLRRRFEHGFRFFAIEEAIEDRLRLVAWLWAVHGVPRYFDELAWDFELDSSLVWGRDAFVAQERRGRRLLAALMDLAAETDQRPRRFISDVSALNQPSLRAHVALGFRELGTVQSLQIGSRLILRGGRLPDWLPRPVALRPRRRWLWLSAEERAWHASRIA